MILDMDHTSHSAFAPEKGLQMTQGKVINLLLESL